jgi:predicted O-methyltransferase YrrM
VTDVLDRIYATGHVEDERGVPVAAFPCGISARHAAAIERVLGDLQLTRTLETGMAYGLSTLTICGVHEDRGDGTHIAIDPGQTSRWRSIGLLNVRRAGLEDRLRLIEARSDEALPRLRDEGVRLDFALIDGRHLFDVALLDFYYVDRMLDAGGVVAFHDTWMPAIADVIAFVRRNRHYERMRGAGRGMALLRKLGDDDRAWDFHRGFGLGPRARFSVVATRAARGLRRRLDELPPAGGGEDRCR